MIVKPIEWMQRAAFIAAYETTYKPDRVALDQEMLAAFTIEGLRAHISTEGARNPPEADEPGPCVRWYGRTGDTLFFITGWETRDSAVLNTRRASQGYPWLVLNELRELEWLWKELTWLRNFKNSDAIDAVCRMDQWEIRRQVYQSDDREETTALLHLLSDLARDVSLFFRCQPDPANSRWAVFDEERRFVGRGDRRDSIEGMARKMSERSGCELSVIEEPAGSVVSRFRDGRIVPAR